MREVQVLVQTEIFHLLHTRGQQLCLRLSLASLIDVQVDDGVGVVAAVVLQDVEDIQLLQVVSGAASPGLVIHFQSDLTSTETFDSFMENGLGLGLVIVLSGGDTVVPLVQIGAPGTTFRYSDKTEHSSVMKNNWQDRNSAMLSCYHVRGLRPIYLFILTTGYYLFLNINL